MVFPSAPSYLDPTNWQQQNHPQGDEINPQLPLPLPPLPSTTAIRPGSMADRARLANIPQPEVSLKCPRCDSANTKFCYFNNYSLNQPRHFCKTCRRYWTRGGTLRNVPVGGGCRKNKRIKRHPALDPAASPPCTDITTSVATSTTTTASSSTTSASINKTSIFNRLAGVSAFCAVPPMGLEGLNSSSNGLDLPPMLSSPWLNFPANATTTNDHHPHHLDYSNQNPSHIGQEHVNSTSLPHDYSLLGSPTSSLLTTTLQQQKLMMGMRESRAFNDFQVLFPTVDLHQSTTINNIGSSSFFKGVKMELQEGHPLSNIPCNTSINDLPLASSDHVNTYWNTGGVGANYWPEATNFGSSITPLI